jgi:iron complex outermembrane receptor protein
MLRRIGLLVGLFSTLGVADEYDLLFSETPQVITASRYVQLSQVAPANVEVLTAEDIRRYGWRTLAEAVSSLAGFQATYDRGYGHLSVRGIQIPGDFNGRILILIDGHRLNENLQDYAGLDSDFPLDLDDVARIEVVRGPASALYGSSAMLAVIQVITKSGAELEGIRLGADAGSFGTYQGRVAAGANQNSIRAYASASLWRRDGRHSLHFPALGRVRELDSQDGRRLFGNFTLGRLTLSGAFMERQKELPSVTTRFGDPGTLFHDRRAYADLRGEHSFGAWQGTMRLFWDRYEFSDRLPQVREIINRDLWHNEQAGLELWLRRRFASHDFLAGLEYRASYLERMDNFDRPSRKTWANNQSTSHVFGFFFQDHWELLPQLTLVLGSRIDHYTRTNSTSINPRLGLVWQVKPNAVAKLLYGRAYRVPNVFEANYRCCEGTWVSNPNVNPEYIHTLEAVFEHRLSPNFKWSLAGFHLRLKDLIQSSSQGGVNRFVNGQDLRSTGMEAGLTASWHDLTANLSYSFAHVETDDGRRAPDSPKHLVKARLAVPILPNRLDLAAEAHWVGQRPTAAGGQSGDYFKLNLSLTATPWPGLEVGLSLYNLLDRPYRDPPSLPMLPVEIPQDGRTFLVRLRYGW